MKTRQIGCQVETSRSVHRPPYFRAFSLGSEETPLVSQRQLSLPDSKARGRP
jgi:hypothetical protein